MKKEITYSEAYSKLEELVGQLEDGNIQLDRLTTAVKQAQDLIEVCENKLRSIEVEVDETTKNKKGNH